MSACFLSADPTTLGFIISPWSLLLMPSGNISFTDENVTQQDLRAFTAPEVLEGLNLSSLSDMEKVLRLRKTALMIIVVVLFFFLVKILVVCSPHHTELTAVFPFQRGLMIYLQDVTMTVALE